MISQAWVLAELGPLADSKQAAVKKPRPGAVHGRGNVSPIVTKQAKTALLWGKLSFPQMIFCCAKYELGTKYCSHHGSRLRWPVSS
jgi:hypothetical protein